MVLIQRFLTLTMLVAAIVSSGPAGASEQSRRLWSQGLVDFNDGHLHQALTRFDEAVAADPADPYARYYRGVTRARLNDTAGAVADLREVAETKKVNQAALELGVVLVDAGDYEGAIPWLQQAQEVPALEARASLYLGVAQLRLGRNDAARRSFDRAEEKDSMLRVTARYYRGIAGYQNGQWSQAERDFGYVAAYDPESDMGREAAAFLRKIRSGELPNAEVYGAVGLQYDSNVVLAPSNGTLSDASLQALDISNQADGRGVITLGGFFIPWRSDRAELSAGYEFYQSLHFQLTDFNLQDHRPTVQGVVNAGIFQFGLLGRYDYFLLGEAQSFLQEVTGLPWVAINETDFGRTEVFYRIRWRDFKKQAYEIRNALNNEVGFRQLFSLGAPERYVAIGYRYDHESPEDASGDPFAYDGNEVSVGGGWSFPWGIGAEIGYAYRYEYYAEQSQVFDPPTRRRDNDSLVFLSLYKQLTEYLAVTAGYFGDFNESNQDQFQYTRNVGSVALEVRFH